MEIIPVNLGNRSYEIAVSRGDGGFAQWFQGRAPNSQVVLVTDANAAVHADRLELSLVQAGVRCQRINLLAGEEMKTLAAAVELWDQFLARRADRRTTVLAVGGGVIGDLAGFVASAYMRGIRWVVAPTTLLAMVDAAIGGKVGVNHPRAKNLIGAFHQPAGVWIDLDTLSTLPDREYRAGLAEVVKYGVALDDKLFSLLEYRADAILARDLDVVRPVVTRCCTLKAGIVEKDERETSGLRSVLNLGHTFAHAIETVAGYGVRLHGEAVSIGMICSARLAERRGLISPSEAQRIEDLLRRFHLSAQADGTPPERLLAAMYRDKKSASGKLRLVLPRTIGDVFMCDDLTDAEISAVLASSQPAV